MPLNHIAGERLEGLDPVFRVVPLEKYKGQPRLTTVVKEMTKGKFQYEVEVERPIWEAALGHAQISYYGAGAEPRHLKYDVLVQEYPRTGNIAFIFCARIRGEERFVIAPFALSPEQIADLTVRGLWQPYRIH